MQDERGEIARSADQSIPPDHPIRQIGREAVARIAHNSLDATPILTGPAANGTPR